MPAGAEADELVRIVHVGLALVVLPFEPRHIHQHRFGSGFARQGRDRHAFLRFVSHGLLHYDTGHGLGVPDVGRVLGDRAVAGELPGAGHVQDRLARPGSRVGVERAQAAVRLEIGREVRQVHVVVARVSSVSRSGAKTPGSLRLKWSEKIRSSAARVSGSLS